MDDAPLTPAASPSDSRIVVDCPTCRRVIWAGTACAHGAVPPPGKDAPKEGAADHKEKLRGGTGE